MQLLCWAHCLILLLASHVLTGLHSYRLKATPHSNKNNSPLLNKHVFPLTIPANPFAVSTWWAGLKEWPLESQVLFICNQSIWELKGSEQFRVHMLAYLPKGLQVLGWLQHPRLPKHFHGTCMLRWWQPFISNVHVWVCAVPLPVLIIKLSTLLTRQNIKNRQCRAWFLQQHLVSEHKK